MYHVEYQGVQESSTRAAGKASREDDVTKEERGIGPPSSSGWAA